MSHLQLKVIDRLTALEPYRQFWTAHAPTPLQSPEWLLSWWQAYQSLNSQLSILVIHGEDNQVLGLAPFCIRDTWSAGRVVRFLGSGQACVDFQSLLTIAGQEEVVGAMVAQWLLSNQKQLGWSMVELEGAAEHDRALNAFGEKLRSAGCLLQPTFLENTWRIDLSEGWSGFLSRLSKTQRRQTRNLLNRFDKQQRWSLRLVREQADIPAALTACIDLHQRRWQSGGMAGCFADPRFRQYILQACEQLAARRGVCIALLEEDGHPLAAQLSVQDESGNLYMYQSGRDPDRDADAVGRVLNILLVRHACEAKLQYIDYLRGNEQYKSRLGAQPAGCLRLRFIPPSILPRLRHGVRSISRSLKLQLDHARQGRLPGSWLPGSWLPGSWLPHSDPSTEQPMRPSEQPFRLLWQTACDPPESAECSSLPPVKSH
jgi:CelD/BcsL family acetyltransferase involved in cellulose biosynthesis